MACKSFRLTHGVLCKVYGARVGDDMVIDFDDDLTQAVLLKQLSEAPHRDPDCAWLGFRLDADGGIVGALRRGAPGHAVAEYVLWPQGRTVAEAFAYAFEGVDANA